MTNKRTIGELIENEVRKQQIPITEFAKMICCQRNNVYDIFKRSKMDIAQLKQISKVLNRNFFKELAEDVELINDSKESEEEVIAEINSLQPNVLFVAMGAPLQEKWIAKHQHELKVDIAAGQGGTFDYEAGKIQRAPKLFQKLGIEWLWRLALQPSRFFRMLVLPVYLIKITFTKDITKGKFD